MKDGTLAPSERRLTPFQVGWHGGWKGQVIVVESAEEALSAVWAAVARSAA